MAGRVGKPLIAILRWFPIVSYALAQIIVVGFWALMLLGLGVDPKPAFDEGLLGAVLLGTAIRTVPLGAILGTLDAAARRWSRLSHPLVQVLLLVLDALVIVLFALVWIVPLEYNSLDRGSCVAEYDCVTITPDWPIYIGVFIGAELGLVVLMVVSVTIRLNVRRSRRGGS
jgi:hypothetical protein